MTPIVDQNDLFSPFDSPLNFPHLDMLQHNVYLLSFGIIDDLEKTNDIGVSCFLENGNFLLDLVFVATILAQSTSLGVPFDDLDGNELARLNVTAKLDFAVYASTKFVDHLVLVDEFSSGDRVHIHISNVSSARSAHWQYQSD